MATYLFNGVSAEVLGITLCSRTLINAGISKVVVRITNAAGIMAAAPWAYDQEVVITRDGVRWFDGYVMRAPLAGTPGFEGRTIELGDVWWKLTRMQYALTEPDSGKKTTRVSVGGERGGGQERSSTVITKVVTYAMAQGLDLSGVSMSLNAYDMPKSVKTDRFCDELLSSAMIGHPDAAVSVDYAINPPALRIRERGIVVTNLTVGVGGLKEVNMTPRPDLVPQGVVFSFQLDSSTVNADGTRPIVYRDVYPSGREAGDLDVISQTITVQNGDGIGSGQARRLYEALHEMPWEGSVVIADEECNTGLYPGKVVNILGGAPAWATMRALVQSVTEDLSAGRTTVTFGLPQDYGIKPKLWSIARRVRNDVTKDAVDGPPEGAGDSEELAPLPGPPGEGWGYFSRRVVGGVTKTFFRVSPMVVSSDDIEDPDSDFVPLWDSSSTPLDATTPPEVEITPGSASVVYLYVEFTPLTQVQAFVDTTGATTNEYHPPGPCIVEEARITFDTGSPAPRKPEWNKDSGVVTLTGRVYMKLCKFTWPDDSLDPTVNPYRHGSFSIQFNAPGRFQFIPNSAA